MFLFHFDIVQYKIRITNEAISKHEDFICVYMSLNWSKTKSLYSVLWSTLISSESTLFGGMLLSKCFANQV